MTEFISEEERERMAEFASIPRYQRTPEMLVPQETREEE